MKKMLLFILILCLFSGLIGGAQAEEKGLWQLSFLDESGAFEVTEAEGGFAWSSCLPEEEYAGLRLNDRWKKSLASLFCMTVTDFSGSSVFTNPQAAKAEIVLSEKAGDMAVDYWFPEYQIGVQLVISLQGDCLTIRVPFQSMREEGKWGLISLDVCPYLLRGYPQEDGYVFYPDGSGAIAYLNRQSITRAYEQTWEIYGLDASEIDDRRMNEESGIYEARMPVFGMKRGDQAALGLVSQGAENAMICYNPKGYILDFDRIFARLQYRKYYTDIRSNLETYVNLDRQIIPQDYEIKIFFLSGEDASYSGMARRYRAYLQEMDLLQTGTLVQEGVIPMNISFFMGIEEEQFLNNRFLAMTTFQQVREILSDLKASGINELVINCKGIGENGYGDFPDERKIAGKLGGEEGLRELLVYCREENIPLTLQYNLMDVTEENLSGYSSYISYQKNGLPVSDLMEENYLISPGKMLDDLQEKYLPYWQKMQVFGLRLQRLGGSIMDDYSKKYALSRQECISTMQQMFSSLQTAGMITATENANDYLFPYVDFLYDLPVQDSGLLLTDEAVPFYQMVVHGFIPYSANSGNAFYDQHRQLLKWIEYGCVPYFEITAEESNLLQFTGYNQLFSSQYSQWKDYILEVSSQFDRLSGIYSTPIYSHEKIDEDVYQVIYENGAAVIINYRNVPYEYQGLQIGAMDFAVMEADETRQGGNEK